VSQRARAAGAEGRRIGEWIHAARIAALEASGLAAGPTPTDA
jgi:hypothetical protein